MTPIHYKLATGQHISDLCLTLNPEHYVTHLCGQTGMGKSSWVMEHELCQQGNVIFAVPQRAQITQLQAKYGDRGDVEFIYGGHSTLSDAPSNIVCTYDQLQALQAQLYCQQYTLVIDEVHKLYQAASYRPDAVSSLVDAITDARFNRVVTLSATFNPELVPYQVDCWLDVSWIEKVERHIELHLFTDKEAAAQQVLAGVKTTDDGPTVIRINNKSAMEQYQQVLEVQGLKCLCVNRDQQSNEDVVEMLTAESMAGYDVVLTTSLLDEAINIQDQHIAELIVLNDTIHPEELKQFIGRFRKCNPPVRICIPHSMLKKRPMKLRADRQSIHAVIGAARQITDVILQDGDILAAVRQTNETLMSLFGFTPLRMKRGKVAANEAAIMAHLYKAHTRECYSSSIHLEKAMRQELKTLTWSVVDWHDHDTESSEVSVDLALGCDNDGRTRALNQCRVRLAAAIAKKKRDKECPVNTVDLLREVSCSFPRDAQERALTHLWLELHQHVLIDPWEAFEALSEQHERQVWHFHDTLHSNIYLKPVLQYLDTLPKGTVLTLAEARNTVLEGLREVCRKHPTFKDLLASSGVNGIRVKRNNHVEVSDRFVRMVFREFTVTPPVRSNNKDKIVFNGLGPFGYQYRLVHSDSPKAEGKRTFRRIRPKAQAA